MPKQEQNFSNQSFEPRSNSLDFEKLIFDLLENFPERSKNVLIRRFGLLGQKETLEKIGKYYGITRERVRQIELAALREFKKSKKFESLKPLEKILENILSEHGKAMEHNHLVKVVIEKGNIKAKKQLIEFILELSSKFEKIEENEHLNKGWILSGTTIDYHFRIIEKLLNIFKNEGRPFSIEQTLKILKEHPELKSINTKQIMAYFNLSKKILKNPFNEWGLCHWSEVIPKGIKDKAYTVLKRYKKPLHFRELTNLINKAGFDHKKAIPQTVHNELIKDKRFVLVGRGIYGLKEWGYESGTVSEIITKILAKEGPQDRNQIVEKVLKQRMVKRSTIILALQNHLLFKKVDQHRYQLQIK